MYSFLVNPSPATVDKNPISHTVHNSVEEVEGAIKDESHYEWFVFKGKKPVTVEFRGKPLEITKGTRFGVRPSANKKNIRLIFKDDPTRVITLTYDQAQQLSKGV